ncbi:family 64 cytochrome P450, partial [Russula vinacea]
MAYYLPISRIPSGLVVSGGLELSGTVIHFPWWFPGAGFNKEAKTWKCNVERCRDSLYETVKRSLDEDRAVPSIAATMITELSENSTEEAIFMAKALPGTINIIGIDTTSAALQSFVLAMVLYPEVQRRAQEEIDSVLAHGYLPDFGDADTLPYLKATLYELLRWACPTPLGAPHRSTKDNIYNGYFIPAGSLVFANIWAILHDPVTYPEPFKFNPERFLDPLKSAPLPDLTFGLGRRVCPGRFFARDMIWLAMANMLATFEFHPAKDAAGRPAPPAQEFTSSFISGPIPFKCTIKPRIPNAKESLLAALQD